MEESDAPDARAVRVTRVHPARGTSSGRARCSHGAERPLVDRRRSAVERRGARALTAWCEASGLPVASGWRRQDFVDNSSDAFAGHLALGADPRLAQRVRDADVLLVIGDRLSEITTAGLHAARACPTRRRRLCTSAPTPTSSAASTRRRSRSSRLAGAFARALAALPPLDRRAREERRARPRGLPRQPPAPSRCRARSTWAT